MTVLHGSLTLFCVTCLAAPAISSAHALITPTPLPVAPPPPVRLFNETLVESSLSPVTIKSANWWEPPAIGNDMPRWRIGYTVKLNTASGFALSAGLSGRKGDPFPLYLSEGFTQRVASSKAQTDHPGSYRLQWDAKFGVTAPLRNTPRLKIDGIGEVIVPLTRSTYPWDRFLTSRVLRFGVGMGF
jgi:hypothetical protein